MNINNVFLNHVYAIIDESTYDEIKNSAFLTNEFCHFEEKTNANQTASWTGIYLTGENTYIELFSSKDKKKLQESELKIADIGVAYSVDHEKEIREIIEVFKDKFPNSINHGLFKKDIDHNLVPWFYYLEFINYLSMKPGLDTWIMAYHGDFLKHKKINYSDNKGFTRKLYNETCNSVLFDKNKLFKDIEEITLLLNDEIKRKLIEQQIALGYNCNETEDYTICRGPGIIFKLKSSKAQTCKLVQLKMSLNHKINNIKEYRIGNSIINLDHQTATWTFL